MGYSHPDHLTDSLTARQLNGWREFNLIDPIGEYRQELRHGQLMELIDRVHYKRDTPLRPVDFMNFTDRPEQKPQSSENVAASIHSFFSVHVKKAEPE